MQVHYNDRGEKNSWLLRLKSALVGPVTMNQNNKFVSHKTKNNKLKELRATAELGDHCLWICHYK